MHRSEWLTRSESETVDRGRCLGERARGGEVITLVGPLGAGKTALAGGIMDGAGAEGPFRSPSFTLVWEHQGRFPIYHVDLYRLQGSEVEFDLPWDRILAGDALALIEWADRLPVDFLPRGRLEIRLKREAEQIRRINLTANGSCVHLLDSGAGGEDHQGARH